MPGLNWQRMRWDFVGGQDESRDPRTAGVTAAQAAVNVEIRKTNAYETRSGFVDYASSFMASGRGVRALFSTGKELCLVLKEMLYAYSPASGGFNGRGEVGVGTGRTTGLFRDTLNYTQCDMCGGGNDGYDPDGANVYIVAAIAEETTYSAGATTSDATTKMFAVAQVLDSDGRVIYARKTLDSGLVSGDYPQAIRATLIGASNAVVTYVYDSTGAGGGLDLYHRYMDTSSFGSGFGARTLLQADIYNSGSVNARTYDLCAGEYGYYRLAYIDHTTRDLYVKKNSAATPSGNVDTYTLAGTFSRVSVCYSSFDNYTYVLVANSASALILLKLDGNLDLVWSVTVSSAPATYADPDNLAVKASVNDGRVCWIATWFPSGGHTSGGLTQAGSVRASDGGVARTRGPLYNSLNRTKFFSGWSTTDIDRSFTECAVSHNLAYDASLRSVDSASVHSEHFVVDWLLHDTSTTITGKYLPIVSKRDEGTAVVSREGTGTESQILLGSANTVSQAFLRDLHPVATRTETWASVVRTQSKTQKRDRFGVDLATLAIGDAVQSTQTSRGLTVIGGSALCSYDGGYAYDLGLPAPYISIVTADTFGAGVLAGDYVYRAIYESVDANGVYHRSSPSQPAKGTATAPDNGFLLRTYSAPNTGRGNGDAYRATVAWFRSAATGAAAGQYARVAPPMLVTGLNRDSKQDEAWNDDGNDAAADMLYTVSGELDSSPPEGAQCCVIAGERVWCAGGWHRDRVAYSKAFAYTSATRVNAPEFNEAFAIGAQHADDIVAIVPQFDAVVAFTSRQVYALRGSGPSNLGGASNWSALTLVVADSGCVDWRSVVGAPPGVFYQSSDGIMLLDPAFNSVPIGAAISDTLADFPFVTSAVVVPHRSQVRFTLANDAQATDEGRIAVYDWVNHAWFVWELQEQITVGGDTVWFSPAIVAACMHDGSYTVVTSTGAILADSEGAQFYDTINGIDSFVPASTTTPWLGSSGTSGYLRVRDVSAFMERGGAHDVQLTIYYDQSDSVSASRRWTEAQLSGIERRIVYRPARQKTPAFAVKVETVKPSGWTSGGGLCRFIGLDLQVGLKNGTDKVQVAQRS